ncbi:hypothetical protein ACFQXA_19035 [Nocardiopsis composta]
MSSAFQPPAEESSSAVRSPAGSLPPFEVSEEPSAETAPGSSSVPKAWSSMVLTRSGMPMPITAAITEATRTTTAAYSVREAPRSGSWMRLSMKREGSGTPEEPGG